MLKDKNNAGGKKIRVLVIDDSALVRRLLTEILRQDPDIEVVGTATDPYVAREMIKKLDPDVLTLDVEMPRMDGLTFLRNLMRLRPMPVVMVSSWTKKGSETTLDALALGAVDFVAKPEPDLINSLGDYAEEIITKVKVAASARVDCLGPAMRSSSPASEEVVSRIDHLPGGGQISLVAIGASTGGTEAIHEVLRTMPKDSPAIVITQHIPENFSLTFARRMDEISEMTVTEAEDGEQIKPGHAYIAPGNRHLRVMKQGNNLYCKVMDGPPVNRHRPSVDVLFNSVAESVGSGAVGVILTGMGKDGARGLLAIKSAGGVTIAQDEKTSVVWGMPGAAVGLECVDEVLPLPDIGVLVRTLSQRQNRKTG